MQQAVSEPTQESPDPAPLETNVNGTSEAAPADSGEAEKTVTSAPMPTYDQSFPSLGGPGAGADGAAPATPFGRWNAKPRVQSSTITQVFHIPAEERRGTEGFGSDANKKLTTGESSTGAKIEMSSTGKQDQVMPASDWSQASN